MVGFWKIFCNSVPFFAQKHSFTNDYHFAQPYLQQQFSVWFICKIFCKMRQKSGRHLKIVPLDFGKVLTLFWFKNFVFLGCNVSNQPQLKSVACLEKNAFFLHWSEKMRCVTSKTNRRRRIFEIKFDLTSCIFIHEKATDWNHVRPDKKLIRLVKKKETI